MYAIYIQIKKFIQYIRLGTNSLDNHRVFCRRFMNLLINRKICPIKKTNEIRIIKT
jgi:hypothetical protein